MSRFVLSMGIALLATSAASAQDWARDALEKSPRHGEWVKLRHGDRVVQAFVVYPEVKDQAPAVVVIHEIFGLTDWVRLVADQLAEAGSIAIAPDLLSGLGPQGGGTEELGGDDAVRRVIGSLPPDQITADLNAAADYVAQLPACDGKVAVSGFCWGGSQSFRFATNRQDLQAAFVFYGTGPGDESAIDRIACPVYGFYGGNDARVNSTIPETRRQMERAGKTFEPVIYQGAGHGFLRAGAAPDANEANHQARDDAWARWKRLLGSL